MQPAYMSNMTQWCYGRKRPSAWWCWRYHDVSIAIP